MSPLRLLATIAALALLVTAPAWGVIRADGDLIVTFDGGLSPKRLPRHELAPVAVHVGGSFRTVSGDVENLPQLRQIVVAINRGGRLVDRGLPICTADQIDPSTEAHARAVCGDAIVGGGRVVVQARIPEQRPFYVHAHLLVFNGPRLNGQKQIYAEVYAPDPPGSFLLTFRVSRRPGTFGTVLSTTLPILSREWAYLTRFEMRLHRRYTYEGRRRSLVSASCAAPPGFRRATFPFALTTYSFANGQELSLSQSAICRVADD